jgi:hypothetical protein
MCTILARRGGRGAFRLIKSFFGFGLVIVEIGLFLVCMPGFSAGFGYIVAAGF